MTKDKGRMFVKYTSTVVAMVYMIYTIWSSIYNKNCIAMFYKHCTFPELFRQEIVTLKGLIEPFVNGIKMKSRDQHVNLY